MTAHTSQASVLNFGRTRRYPQRWASFTTVRLVVILVVVVTLLYAILRVVLEAMTPAAFSQLLKYPGLGAAIWNTVFVVVVAAAIALVVGTVMAYINERTDGRLGIITDILPFMPFLMPPIAGAIGWVMLLAPVAGYVNGVLRWLLGFIGINLVKGPFDIYSLPGLIFVYAVYMIPYVFLQVSAGIRNLDPATEEQSRVSGAGPFKTFFKITLPGLTSSLASAGLLVVWSGFAMFAVPQTIGAPANIPILSVETVVAITGTYPANINLGVMLSLVTMVFVGAAWFSQSLIRSRSKHATVGGRSTHVATRIQLGWWKWPIRALSLAAIVVMTVLPALGLLLVSLNGWWTLHIQWSQLSFSSFSQAIFGNQLTMNAITETLMISVVVATVAAVVASMVSTLLVGRTGRWLRALDGVLKLPVIISPLVIGLGFIFAFVGRPFSLGGTITILIVAFILLDVPKASVSTDAAAGEVGRDLSEASQVSGAGQFKTFLKIYFPLMLPAIAIAWALAFVRVLGDLEISVLLAGSTNPTIGYQTMMLYSAGSTADVASLSLVTLVVSTVIVSVVLLVSRRLNKWNAVHVSAGVVG